MAYPSLTLHLLISAPGDMPPDDLRVVRETIDAWNFSSGRWLVPTPVTVIPVQWGVHAYSQMGVRPQEAINQQFVEEADLALALFADRLGTPTGRADSGTVEEMDVMRRAGKHISLVHNTSARPLNGAEAAEQKMLLEQYLAQVKREGQGLVIEYQTLDALARSINLMLTGQAMAFAQTAKQPMTADVEPRRPLLVTAARVDPSVGVWPSVEVIETPFTDSKGQLKSRRNWYLVLNNRTGKPVKNVHYRYETYGAEPFDLRPHTASIELIGPDDRQRFPIVTASGTTPEAMCVVTWQYYHPKADTWHAGMKEEVHETRATVRTN